MVERSGIFAERLCERGAALHVHRDARGDLTQRLGVVLLGQDLQALRDRQARVDHRRELTRVDREIFVADLAAEFLRRGRRGGLDGFFLYRGRDHAFGAQRGDGSWTAVRLDLARHGTECSASPPRHIDRRGQLCLPGVIVGRLRGRAVHAVLEEKGGVAVPRQPLRDVGYVLGKLYWMRPLNAYFENWLSGDNMIARRSRG